MFRLRQISKFSNKLSVAVSYVIQSPLIKPNNSLTFWQKFNIRSYPKPTESNPFPPWKYFAYASIILPPVPRSFKCSFPSGNIDPLLTSVICPVTSTLPDLSIFLSTLFSVWINIRSSSNMIDKVLQPYNNNNNM